jgi:hypothetical protein
VPLPPPPPGARANQHAPAEGLDPRPDARTDPEPLRGPLPSGKGEWERAGGPDRARGDRAGSGHGPDGGQDEEG